MPDEGRYLREPTGRSRRKPDIGDREDVEHAPRAAGVLRQGKFMGPARSLLHRQPRLRAVERLDLALSSTTACAGGST
jgi:hypothetical protein